MGEGGERPQKKKAIVEPVAGLDATGMTGRSGDSLSRHPARFACVGAHRSCVLTPEPLAHLQGFCLFICRLESSQRAHLGHAVSLKLRTECHSVRS